MTGDRSADRDVGQTRIPIDELIALVSSVLVRHGASVSVADVIAANCVAAERDGSRSHGLFRVPGYVASLKSGWVNGRAEVAVREVAPACLVVDANNGFAQPAVQVVQPLLAEKAKKFGIAMAAIRDSHHLGALWIDVEPLACQGFVALAMVNGIARVMPYGARRPVFGTNPIAFAVPRGDLEPIVVDQSASVMSFGDVRLAAREGRAVPPGTGVDSRGVATTDAAAIVDGGGLLPFGGYKGSSIALLVEVMAAALTGGRFSFEVDTSGFPGAESPRTGELILVLDPAASAGGAFRARVDTLAAMLLASGVERLPGDRRYRQRQAASDGKLPVCRSDMDRLTSLLEG